MQIPFGTAFLVIFLLLSQPAGSLGCSGQGYIIKQKLITMVDRIVRHAHEDKMVVD